jgi:peptide/nickel transport system permease protein
MTRRDPREALWRALFFGVSILMLVALVVAGVTAPEFLPSADVAHKFAPMWRSPPFGTDYMGRSYLAYALQGCSIVALPSALAGAMVGFLAVLAGLSRAAGLGWTDTVLQAFTEIVGALPRLVVILVVALAVPQEYRTLYPIAFAWAFLAAPGAMDEAAATAERLGGARFVEALRAHGFSAARIYLYHITWLNLRSVIVRQATDVLVQVVFLEISISYLAKRLNTSSLTHLDSQESWASLLYDGYSWLLGQPTSQALLSGALLLAWVTVMTQAMRLAARAR